MRLLGAVALVLLALPVRAADPPTSQPAADSHGVSSAGTPVPGDGTAAESVQPVPAIATAIAGPQLTVEDLRPGAGVEAVAGTLVAVHYTGWLRDLAAPGQKGHQFDSSRGRRAFVFPLGAGRVIKGWDLGVAGMRVGGLRRLTIPPELAYGSRAVGGGLIPANSTLVFEVELLGVESVRDTPGAR